MGIKLSKAGNKLSSWQPPDSQGSPAGNMQLPSCMVAFKQWYWFRTYSPRLILDPIPIGCLSFLIIYLFRRFHLFTLSAILQGGCCWVLLCLPAWRSHLLHAVSQRSGFPSTSPTQTLELNTPALRNLTVGTQSISTPNRLYSIAV